MFSIFAARMFEQRVLETYREHVAEERRLQLLRELEDEDRVAQEREAKKAQENQRKKDKRRQQKLAKESERAKRDADQLAEEQARKQTQEEEALRRNKEEQLKREAERKSKEEEEKKRLADEKGGQVRERKVKKEQEQATQKAGRVEDRTKERQEEKKQGEASASQASLLELASAVKTGNNPDSAQQSFYPVDDDRPRPFLSFARFDNDPELLSNIQDLNVPVLKNAVWRPNSDGALYGGFGYVERAAWNNQDVAVKFLRGAQTVSGKARGKRSFRRELIAWRQLNHPNILPFLGVVCVENKYLGMVSPYMPNGSAPRYIAKHPEANVLQILHDVATGMSHLAAQEPPIAHGDLKGENVLIDQDGRARICDFGLSKFMRDFQSIETRCGGTTRWMAPEQILSETTMVSLSADIFSWGMVSLELMTGSIPWHDVQQDNIIVIKVAVKNQRPNRPSCKTPQCQARLKCVCLMGDDALWALIQQCWLSDPDERPTAAQLCEALTQIAHSRATGE